MQRIKKVEKDVVEEAQKPRWRKLGGGTHTMRDGTRVGTGQVVHAWEWELKGVLDLFECLDPQTVEEPDEKELVTLKIAHRGGGWFDVINPITNKRINERALKKDQAEALVGCPVNDELDEKIKEVLGNGKSTTDSGRKEESEETVETPDTEDPDTEDPDTEDLE